MTLDVTIGKIELNQDKIEVVGCEPVHFDICNPDATIYPREAYRSGSTGLWGFFQVHVKELYFRERKYPHSNDEDIIKLMPPLPEIKALRMPDNEFDKDRMVWLKFWVKRAYNYMELKQRYSFREGVK